MPTMLITTDDDTQVLLRLPLHLSVIRERVLISSFATVFDESVFSDSRISWQSDIIVRLYVTRGTETKCLFTLQLLCGAKPNLPWKYHQTYNTFRNESWHAQRRASAKDISYARGWLSVKHVLSSLLCKLLSGSETANNILIPRNEFLLALPPVLQKVVQQ